MTWGGKGKPSAKCALFRFIGTKKEGVDPKPGELTMSRVKSRESGMEARTRQSYKSVGRLVVRGNMPIEPGDSWFSPKYILV